MAAAIAHGGGLIAAAQRFPDAPRPWLDLSTGINPVAYPLTPMPADTLARLPEPEQVAALEAVAARAYGVADPAAVVAGPGTQALIHLLPRLRPRGTVSVLSPTYAEHAAAWALAGHAVSEVATPEEAAVVVAVRPNNPDGRILPAEAVLRLTDQVASKGGLLVLDEAFADLEGCSLAQFLPRPGLLILRSFGKTYGLAGLRLGFALTSPELAGALRAGLGPWAVSGPAIWAGSQALADGEWPAAAGARLAQDAARLDDLLSRAGGRVVGGTRLFRLVEHANAAALADRLGRAGILVRRFAEAPTRLRFGLPGAAADWDRLGAALG